MQALQTQTRYFRIDFWRFIADTDAEVNVIGIFILLADADAAILCSLKRPAQQINIV